MVSSIDLIPQPENHPLIHAPLPARPLPANVDNEIPEQVDNEISEEVAMPVQFAKKVNLFKDRTGCRSETGISLRTIFLIVKDGNELCSLINMNGFLLI